MTAALLAAAIPAAYGQDATPPAAKQSADPSSATPPSGGAKEGSQAADASADTTNGSPTSGTRGGANAQGAADAQATAGTPATTAAQANGAGKSGKPPAVCFKLTGRCVEGSEAPAAKGGTAKANLSKDGSTGDKSLNLTAPDVRTVVSADELKEPLPSNDQIAEGQEADTVSIKGEGVPSDVPMGFGAIWWALNHPSQAWRIVTPYE
jgi:hypothetical protein